MSNIKQILRQKVNSEIGYNDWIIASNLPTFTQDGESLFPMKSIDDLGYQYFTIKEISEMEFTGKTTVD